jgi:uncharacterized membrane protein YkoI
MADVSHLSAAVLYSSGAMRTVLEQSAVVIALAFMLAGSAPAGAESRHRDRDDHERARHALEQGRARPLAEILERVRDRLGGEVVGVEFGRERGRYVYEFKVITPAGRLREMHVDAMTAEIIESEGD